jgi:hypothetical protein
LRRVLVTFLVLLLGCALSGRPALAQEPDDGDEDPNAPWNLSEQELEATGWQWSPAGLEDGSVVSGILAATVPGVVFHGVGHITAGDDRTGWTLFVAELVSVASMGAGFLTRELTDSDGGWAALYRPTTLLGGSIFLATWLLDVIGTFKGSSSDFPSSSHSVRARSLSVAYTYLASEGLPLANAVVADVHIDWGPFFFDLGSDFGLDAEYVRFDLGAGMRFGLGRRDLSYIALELEASEAIFGDLGFAFEAIVATVGLSLDLGDVFAHLDGVIYRNRIGFGTQLIRFDFDESSGPLAPDNVSNLMVAEASMSANATENFLIEIGYLDRPDALLTNVSSSVAAFFATLTLVVSERFDVYVDGRLGDGFQLFTGTTVYLSRGAEADAGP